MRDSVLLFSIPAFIIFMIIEAVVAYRKGRDSYETKDTWASLSSGIGSVVVGALAKTGILFIMEAVYQLSPFHIPITWWSWILCFIAIDFCFYWAHRFGHEVRIGWAAHVPHHNSQKYNLSTALRQSWTHHYFFFIYLPVPLMGFTPEQAFFTNAINTVYQFWIHTEYVGKLWWPIEFIFNTPSHHRVHHASDPKYLDKNYGGALIIWDRLFGTFVEEQERPTYGITKNITSHNPIVVNFHEWVDIAKDVRRAHTWRERLGYMFMPPGWFPGQVLTRAKIARLRSFIKLSRQLGKVIPKSRYSYQFLKLATLVWLYPLFRAGVEQTVQQTGSTTSPLG